MNYRAKISKAAEESMVNINKCPQCEYTTNIKGDMTKHKAEKHSKTKMTAAEVKQDKEHLTVLKELNKIEDAVEKHTIGDTKNPTVKEKAKALVGSNYRKLIEQKAARILKAVEDGGDDDMCYDKKEIGSPMEFELDGEKMHLDMSRRYNDGKQAILVQDESGAPYATLSVNLDVELQPGEFLIKTYSENEEVAAAVMAKGWFVDTGKRVRSGYVEIPIWRKA
jgi:hypothetical protein